MPSGPCTVPRPAPCTRASASSASSRARIAPEPNAWPLRTSHTPMCPAMCRIRLAREGAAERSSNRLRDRSQSQDRTQLAPCRLRGIASRNYRTGHRSAMRSTIRAHPIAPCEQTCRLPATAPRRADSRCSRVRPGPDDDGAPKAGRKPPAPGSLQASNALPSPRPLPRQVVGGLLAQPGVGAVPAENRGQGTRHAPDARLPRHCRKPGSRQSAPFL